MNFSERETEISAAPALVGRRRMNHESVSILVVEDEDFVREVTCEVLRAADYSVVRARTAPEAIKLFSESAERPNLMIADIVLPGRSGRLLASDLRAMSPELKIIFISGYPENRVHNRTAADPYIFYLPKPFSADMLLQKVRATLCVTVPQRDVHEVSANLNKETLSSAPNESRLKIGETTTRQARKSATTSRRTSSV